MRTKFAPIKAAGKMNYSKTYKPSIKDLNNIPLTGLTNDYLRILTDRGSHFSLDDPDYMALVEEFSSRYRLKYNADWFWGQAMARIATTALPLGSDGLYSAKTWYLETIKNDSILYALSILAKYPKRSSLVDKQTDPKNRNCCSLVPLMMAAHKKINNIPYEKWNKSELVGIVEKSLLDAMLTQVADIDRDDIMQAREIGLTPKTGKMAGIPKNPGSTYGINVEKDSPLGCYAPLVRMMICQTWCAHPVNRTNLMILDPSNWDNLPTPLVTTDIFNNDTSWAL